MSSISARSDLRALNLMFAGLILAIIGQVFTERHFLGPGMGLYIVALGLWIAGLVIRSRDLLTASTVGRRATSDDVQIRRLPLLLSLLLALVTFLTSTNNTF